MRTIIFFQLLLLSTGISFAQKTQLLKDYDFDKGGYYLLGTFSESDRNGLRDTLGEFYTDDISVLNRFKKEWTFKKPSPFYACGYHYTISICKDGLEVERFAINLNCNMIATDKGYFYFDSQKLRMFVGKLKKAFERNDKFSSLTVARDMRTNILKREGLIMVETPDWAKYEGEFDFICTFPKDSERDRIDEEKILEEEIKAAYPGETFALSVYMSSTSELWVNVKCNKTLADKFKLYPFFKGEQWKAYDLPKEAYDHLRLRSYWTTSSAAHKHD